MKPPYLSVVIPAYNESRRIAPTIRSVATYLAAQSYVSEILIVLNNCTDDTLAVVTALEAEIPMLRHMDIGMIQSPSGTKGLAVRSGMLAATGEYRIYMDADNAARIEEIEKLWPYIHSGYDVVFGSRYVAQSEVHVSWYRRMLSRVGNLTVQILLLPGVRDTQCAFKIFTARATHNIFSRMHIAGWGFDMEALFLAKRFGFRMREVAIEWREIGGSSVKPKAFVTALEDLVRIRVGAWRGRYTDSK